LGHLNHSSASDFAYSYLFLRSVVCRLSVVCHTRAPCLNRSTDLHAIWQLHLRGLVTHCVRWGPWPQRQGEYFEGVERPSKKLHLLTYDSPGGSIDQRFCFVSNDFDHLFTPR